MSDPIPQDERNVAAAAPAQIPRADPQPPHSPKDRTVSIEEPRASFGSAAAANGTTALKRGPSGAARKRTQERPPAIATSSSRSRNLNGEPVPDTARSAKSAKSLTLASMGILKDKNEDGTPKWREPTVKEGIRAIIFASWLNVLVIFVPISWALHFALDKDKSSSDTIIFVTCFLAIIPLAKLLAWGTEELALRVGQTLGGLLNATFGNVVELIVGVIALVQCKLNVVQSSLVGSILSNLLLVLGMCFFAGGTRFSEQGFIQTTAQLNTSLLILSVTAILIPAAFHVAIANSSSEQGSNTDSDQPKDILKMSHGVALILLMIYGASLIFQLWSHAHLYADKGEYAPMKSTRYPKRAPRHPGEPGRLTRTRRKLHLGGGKKEEKEDEAIASTTATNANGSPAMPRSTTNMSQISNTVENGPALSPLEEGSHEGSHTVTTSDGDIEAQEEEEDDEEVPLLTLWTALGLLLVVTVLVAVTAEFLVSSIDGLTRSGTISEEWVGLILLPIVGNAAEHVTAVTVSVKDKLDLSIGVAVGSSIQIALFVIPMLVLLGWILGKPLTLLFDPYESIVLFLAVLTVAFCINDGRSNWLEGVILMSLYVILGTAFWFYPANTTGNC